VMGDYVRKEEGDEGGKESGCVPNLSEEAG